MEKSKINEEIKNSRIFIYPTDTIYGIGCNALSKDAVNKIREIKGRDNKPFSVIAPSIEWIQDNLVVDCDLSKYLPGPYTIILKKKNPEFLQHVSEAETLGVRIPKNSFTKIIQEAGAPFITTSVNLSGKPFALTLNEIPKEIKNKVDYIIPAEKDEKLSGTPSKLIINGKEINRK